ncbi:hypothetical protein SUGI_0435810 [Cryptomeria japonica]|nr:hypothetical protein SUGI_0435810 [Cryptomeria japonica]
MRKSMAASLVFIFFLLLSTHKSFGSQRLLLDKTHEKYKLSEAQQPQAYEQGNQSTKCESEVGKAKCENGGTGLDEESHHIDYIYSNSQPGN